MNARKPSLSQLVVIAHDSRLIILFFISHSLRASRIPSKRGNPHADTRSGIDASWLACRGADYAPRLRSSPRMAQDSLVSLPFSTFLLFILLSRTQGGCGGGVKVDLATGGRPQVWAGGRVDAGIGHGLGSGVDTRKLLCVRVPELARPVACEWMNVWRRCCVVNTHGCKSNWCCYYSLHSLHSAHPQPAFSCVSCVKVCEGDFKQTNKPAPAPAQQINNARL